AAGPGGGALGLAAPSRGGQGHGCAAPGAGASRGASSLARRGECHETTSRSTTIGTMGTTSTTRGARARTVDGSPAPAPVVVRRGPSGVLAALQAFVLSLAVVVLPGVVAFLGSSSGTSEGSGWGQSVTIAAGFWLLGHGVALV